MKHLFIFSLLIFYTTSFAQTKTEISNSKKIYEGTWVNKNAKRSVAIFYDDEVDYVTINDWTGSTSRNKSKNVDSYKAFIKGNKLILPAENGDHHSTYCEITVINKKLNYKCNTGLNFKDNFLRKENLVENTVFVKVRD